MTIHNTLSQLANQCVMCGLCIPHCPTYQLFQTESESPRGRIALFKALADRQLDITPGMIDSLDHCLACQACEKMCPSQVNYSRINNLGRELLARQDKLKHSSFNQKLAEKMLTTPSMHPLLKLTAKALAPIQAFIRPASSLSAVGNFSRELAADSPALSPLKNDDSIADAVGKVILFQGCSGDLFERQVLADSRVLLNAAGYNVTMADKQQCCGAIKLRQGDTRGMLAQARKTIDSFTPWLAECSAIVSVNNSCSGQLKAFNQLASYSTPMASSAPQTLPGADETAGKTSDIIAFLAQALKTDTLRFAPLPQAVMVHIPCSLKNVLKEEQSLFQLLEQIPGIRLKRLNDQFCCGAAGSYMLRYPDVANRLLDDKIKDVRQYDSQTIVSSNLGCTLHFKQGLEQQGQSVEVIHPVRLLARQLITED